MKTAELKAMKVKSVDFISDAANGAKLELTHSYSYNVGYSTNNLCEGTFTAKIKAKGQEDKFHIYVVMVGVFSFRDGASKEQIHLDTYDQLFPYVRSLITTITANGGIPPVIAPYIDITGKEIYRLELNDINNEEDI